VLPCGRWSYLNMKPVEDYGCLREQHRWLIVLPPDPFGRRLHTILGFGAGALVAASVLIAPTLKRR
jgi:hypothetical protein